MPFIALPPTFDVPAIVRVAAHASGGPAIIPRPVLIGPSHTLRPNDIIQSPEIVNPVSPARPQSSPTSRAGSARIDRPNDVIQSPEIVGPTAPPNQ
jgi:hypothetical protein